MSEGTASGVETELDRDIGVVGAVALGVGTMIAAGIFVLSGLAVSNVGAMAIVAFVIAAVVASFTAFAYAEFAAIYPESGGGYAYVANTFDTDVTYIVGWSMILGYPASAAFYLASFSQWFFEFMYPVFGIPRAVPYWVAGLLVLALLVGLNLKGTEETGTFQIVVTAIKVALIVLFLWGALGAFDASVVRASVVENLGKFQQIGLTSALVFITFFGFEAIATNAEEIKEPGRTIPRAIFFSMGFVTVVYALVVTVIVLAVNDPQYLSFLTEQVDLGGLLPEEYVARRGEVSMAYAAKYYLDFAGNAGFYVIIVGALFSMISAANATILAGSRVKLAMARRDHLPSQFERLHPSLNTPHRAVLLTGGFILVFIFLFTVVFGGGPETEAVLHVAGTEFHLGIDAIAHFADFMLLTGLVVVNLAVIYSRRKRPDLERPFRVPAVPWVPILAVLANLALLVNVERSSFVLGVLAEVVGAALWFGVVSRVREERMEREAPAVVEERYPKERETRVLVPIANPAHVEQLMRTAVDVAADRGGDVLVMSVVSLPEQTPLSRGHQYVDERREVVDRAMQFAREELDAEVSARIVTGDQVGDEPAQAVEPDESAEPAAPDEPTVPVHGMVRIAHHVDEAILHTVRHHECDTVVLGWSGRHKTHRRDIVLGTVVDAVATRARADVLVERIAADDDVDLGEVESILVPTAGGPHAAYAGEVARAIARTTGASVTLFRVVPPGTDTRAAVELLAEPERELADAGVDVETAVAESPDVVDAIVDDSREHDLTIIGATREGLLQQLVLGAKPEAVGRRADSTVIMAKRDMGITSRVRRWLGGGQE